MSKRTIIWETGAFGKIEDAPTFSVSRTLAEHAKTVAGTLETGFGSESSDESLPFFIARNTFDPAPTEISSTLIKACFAGALFPAFSIAVEPMDDQTDWWQHVLHDIEGSASDHLERWTALRAFFSNHPDFTDSAFVSIGTEEEGWSTDDSNWPAGTIMAPSTFPRLLLGLTKGGSLSGLLGWCVYT